MSLHELAFAGVTELMLETRQRNLNRDDERTIASARRDGLVCASMPFAFAGRSTNRCCGFPTPWPAPRG